MHPRILIVDDNVEKVARVKSLLHKEGALEQSILVAADLFRARQLLDRQLFDLLILDLNIPERSGETPVTHGGLGLMRELLVSPTFTPPSSLIGLSEYSDLVDSQIEQFDQNGWEVVHYDASSSAWESRLALRVRHILRRSVSSGKSIATRHQFDVAIVAALQSPELDAVRTLDFQWKVETFPNDSIEYLVGSCDNALGGRLHIVACSPGIMGMCGTAVLVTKLIANFRPRVIFMCGIAAGVRGKVNIGDLLIAEESWDYNSGKLVSGSDVHQRRFQPDPKSIQIEADLRDLFVGFKMRNKFVNECLSKWTSAGWPSTRPTVHIGPVASGASVIQDPSVVVGLVERNRKLIGLEMETFGFYFAAKYSLRPRPLFCSLKAVCDFADESKGDDMQGFSSFFSAQYLGEVIRSAEFSRMLSIVRPVPADETVED